MKTTEFTMIIGNIDEEYIEEAGLSRSRGFRIRKVMLAAAVICMMTVFTAAAFASDWFGIRSLLLTVPQAEDIQAENIQEMQQESDTITLAGLADTDEYMAAAEWHEFLASYDVMGAAGSSNGIFAPGTSYIFYQVYNQEMADKLDEITGKYGLNLHSSMVTDIFADEVLCEMAGGDFLGESSDSGGAYMYEDGTFRFDGTALLEGAELEYQFMRSVKGTFNDVTLNIGEAGQYEEWSFVTGEGVTVTLAEGPHRSLVIADFEDCIVTVIVLAGKETPPSAILSDKALDKTMLETFAESFDFSVLTPVIKNE